MKGTVTPSAAFFTGDDQQLASNLRAQIDEVQGIFVVPLRELVASTHFTVFRFSFVALKYCWIFRIQDTRQIQGWDADVL